jgi:hypothetical protein
MRAGVTSSKSAPLEATDQADDRSRSTFQTITSPFVQPQASQRASRETES